MMTRTTRRTRPAQEPLESRAMLSGAGDLDPTFGAGGIVTTAFSRGEQAWTVLPQPDGKIVAVGQGDMARYLANGSLDGSFGKGGKVASLNANGAALYPPGTANAGKIVVVGQASNAKTGADFSVTRYLANGAVDTSFGNRGTVTADFAGLGDGAYSVAVQSDGKLVVAGYAQQNSSGTVSRRIALARYNANGALDTSFGSGGKVLTPDLRQAAGRPVSVALDANRNIAVATTTWGDDSGGKFTVARYTANGALDPSFGPDGRGFVQVIDMLADHPGVVPVSDWRYDTLAYEANDVTVQADGRIVAVGTTYGNSLGDGWLVARFDTAGNLDPGFGIRGTTFLKPSTDPNGDEACGVSLQADGEIVVAGGSGNASGFYVGRLDAAGALDATFGSGGIAATLGAYQTRDVAIQPDGKIVVAGSAAVGSVSGFGLARYLASDTATTTTLVRPSASADTVPLAAVAVPALAPATGDTASNWSPTPPSLLRLPARWRSRRAVIGSGFLR